MNSTIKNILIDAAKNCNFVFIESFSNEDMKKSPKKSYCIPSIKSQIFSPRVRAVNSETYGVEADFELKIRLIGKNNNYSDYQEFSNNVTSFLNYLGLKCDVIIVKLLCNEIERNNLLGRLETDILVQLKCCYLSDNSISNGGA